MSKQKSQFKNISYDKESEILSFKVKRGKSVDSDVQEYVVLDYDKKGDVVRIDFYDFDFSAFKEHVASIKSFARHMAVPFAVR